MHGQQLGLRELAFLQDGVDGEVLEEVARHLVQLRLGRRRDDHAEVEGIALELGLHREALQLFDRVPGDEHLLGRLQDVGVLRGEVAAGRARHRRQGQARDQGGGHSGHATPAGTKGAHGAVLSLSGDEAKWLQLNPRPHEPQQLASDDGVSGPPSARFGGQPRCRWPDYLRPS